MAVWELLDQLDRSQNELPRRCGIFRGYMSQLTRGASGARRSGCGGPCRSTWALRTFKSRSSSRRSTGYRPALPMPVVPRRETQEDPTYGQAGEARFRAAVRCPPRPPALTRLACIGSFSAPAVRVSGENTATGPSSVSHEQRGLPDWVPEGIWGGRVFKHPRVSDRLGRVPQCAPGHDREF